MGQFCTLQKEQCLRRYLVKELGSDEVEFPDADECCSNCSTGVIPHTQISNLLKRTDEKK